MISQPHYMTVCSQDLENKHRKGHAVENPIARCRLLQDKFNNQGIFCICIFVALIYTFCICIFVTIFVALIYTYCHIP